MRDRQNVVLLLGDTSVSLQVTWSLTSEQEKHPMSSESTFHRASPQSLPDIRPADMPHPSPTRISRLLLPIAGWTRNPRGRVVTPSTTSDCSIRTITYSTSAGCPGPVSSTGRAPIRGQEAYQTDCKMSPKRGEPRRADIRPPSQQSYELAIGSCRSAPSGFLHARRRRW
jgi:hypothetical protein